MTIHLPPLRYPFLPQGGIETSAALDQEGRALPTHSCIGGKKTVRTGTPVGVYEQRFPNRVRIHNKSFPATPRPLDILSKISTLPQEKWALQGEIFVPCYHWMSLRPGWGRWGEENGMDGRSLCWMGFPHSQFHANLSFNHAALCMYGSNLLTKRIHWTDFTARAASSDTSGRSETAGPTLPSSKSKGLAQKKRLNSTLERSADLPARFSTDKP